MSTTIQPGATAEALDEYKPTRMGLKEYLHDLADSLFPFPGYREYQDEILYETLDALLIEGYKNVIVEGPTGIGKSPINVTLALVMAHIERNKDALESYFGIPLTGIETGKSFYTTPQKQLRNQLAQDDDLQDFVTMLKSREDYYCNAGGTNCKDCTFAADKDTSCRKTAGCTYWGAKVRAMDDDTVVLTFAMQVVDHHIPPMLMTEGMMNEEQISFKDRDLEIVDEAHGLENQVASLFAGFSVSQWILPEEVYRNTSAKIQWNFERFEDAKPILDELQNRAKNYIESYEDIPNKEPEVEQCENFIRKMKFCRREVAQGRPWVVSVSELGSTGQKKMTVKPVDVDGFLSKFIWSRGSKRVISSATIPYRGAIEKWTERIGLDGHTKFISKPMPFPEAHREIHTNTIVGSMSGDGEEKYWRAAVEQINEIHSHHVGEKGLIHTNSYQRAEKLGEALGDDAIVQDQEKEQDVVIAEWQESDADILLSPSMTEGVDLYEDRCRWQVLLKVPYPYVGDNRVSYLLNERNDWTWYMETASLDVQQSVGRAVRGPEPEEAASYYVLDAAFNKLMARTDPPEWFTSAITDEPPEHWSASSAAPWRTE